MTWIVVITVGVAGIGATAGTPFTYDRKQVEDINLAVACFTWCTVSRGTWGTGVSPAIKDAQEIKHIRGSIPIKVRGTFRQGIKALVGPLDAFDPEPAISGVTGTESPEADDVDFAGLDVQFQV